MLKLFNLILSCQTDLDTREERVQQKQTNITDWQLRNFDFAVSAQLMSCWEGLLDLSGVYPKTKGWIKMQSSKAIRLVLAE